MEVRKTCIFTSSVGLLAGAQCAAVGAVAGCALLGVAAITFWRTSRRQLPKLAEAASNNDIDTFCRLLAHPASPKCLVMRTSGGVPLIHSIIKNPKTACPFVKGLRDFLFAPCAADGDTGRISRVLLCTDGAGNTLFHVAVELGNPDVLEVLFDCLHLCDMQANPLLAKNRRGLTPAQVLDCDPAACTPVSEAQAEARALAIYFQGVRSAMTEVDVIAKVHTVRSIGACMEELARSPADPVRAVQLVRTRVLRALNEIPTALHLVCLAGRLHPADELLKARAAPHVLGVRGHVALHELYKYVFAAEQSSVAKLLIKQGPVSMEEQRAREQKLSMSPKNVGRRRRPQRPDLFHHVFMAVTYALAVAIVSIQG